MKKSVAFYQDVLGRILGDEHKKGEISVEGKTVGLDRAQMRDKLHPWVEADATWWMEILEGENPILTRIQQGPPHFD